MVNDLVARALRSAGVPAALEPSGLLRSDGKRPDRASLIRWSCGKTLVWDFTCPDNFTPLHLINTSRIAGASAVRKEKKYSAFAPAHIFVPVAIEIMGVWGSGASDLIRDLGGRLTVQLGDPQAATHFKQRLDVAVLRGNAITVIGTFPEESNKPKDALLVEDVVR